MTTEKKCCGSCEHFQFTNPSDLNIGACFYIFPEVYKYKYMDNNETIPIQEILPFWVNLSNAVVPLYVTSGCDCPVFCKRKPLAPKEGKDHE